jgi:hypothetical protein
MSAHTRVTETHTCTPVQTHAKKDKAIAAGVNTALQKRYTEVFLVIQH